MVSVADLRSAKRLSTATWDSLSPEDRRYAHSLLGSMYRYYDDLATYTAIANGRLEQLKEELSLAEEGLANYAQEVARLTAALEWCEGEAEKGATTCWHCSQVTWKTAEALPESPVPQPAEHKP